MSLDLLFHLFFLVQRVTPVLLLVSGTIGVLLSLSVIARFTSHCPWWHSWSWRWAPHYGNSMRNTQRWDEKLEEGGWCVFILSLSSAVWGPSRVTLEGTAIETCTSCTQDEWPELMMGCHDKEGATRCYADTFLRACLHVFSLLGPA